MDYVSILGDSVSMFRGCNPPQNAVYYDEYTVWMNGLSGVGDKAKAPLLPIWLLRAWHMRRSTAFIPPGGATRRWRKHGFPN